MKLRCLTVLALVAGTAGCMRRVANDAALAVAASDSVTQALSDSLAPVQGFAVRQEGAPAESFSACHDNEESVGWQTVGSLIVDMELPSSNYTADPQTKDHAGWTGSTGSVRVSQQRGANHGYWSSDITSECDIYISGSPAHIDLVTNRYGGRGVYATIRPSDAPAIELEARAQSAAEQSQLLHSIRTARISAAWGKKD